MERGWGIRRRGGRVVERNLCGRRSCDFMRLSTPGPGHRDAGPQNQRCQQAEREAAASFPPSLPLSFSSSPHHPSKLREDADSSADVSGDTWMPLDAPAVFCPSCVILIKSLKDRIPVCMGVHIMTSWDPPAMFTITLHISFNPHYNSTRFC